MGRSPCCCVKKGSSLKKGPWTPEEDEMLVEYVNKHGNGNWRALPEKAGLNRCGKSCRLRWMNYLRPDIKRGNFSEEEERIIIQLHKINGNKWSKIATFLPGRTDNEIKNLWNTHIRKKMLQSGIDPDTHLPRRDHLSHLGDLSFLRLLARANLANLLVNQWKNTLGLQDNTDTVLNLSTGLENLRSIVDMQVLGTNPASNVESTLFGDYHNNAFNAIDYQSQIMNSWAGGSNLSGQVVENLQIPGLGYDSSSEKYYCGENQAESPVSNQNGMSNNELQSQNSSMNVDKDYWEKLMEDDETASFLREILE